MCGWISDTGDLNALGKTIFSDAGPGSREQALTPECGFSLSSVYSKPFQPTWAAGSLWLQTKNKTWSDYVVILPKPTFLTLKNQLEDDGSNSRTHQGPLRGDQASGRSSEVIWSVTLILLLQHLEVQRTGPVCGLVGKAEWCGNHFLRFIRVYLAQRYLQSQKLWHLKSAIILDVQLYKL